MPQLCCRALIAICLVLGSAVCGALVPDGVPLLGWPFAAGFFNGLVLVAWWRVLNGIGRQC